MRRLSRLQIVLATTLLLVSCDDSTTDSSPTNDAGQSGDANSARDANSGEAIDIKDAFFTDRSPACRDYLGQYTAAVMDDGRNTTFDAEILILESGQDCTLTSNGIPNHDFNINGSFATPVSTVTESFNIVGTPTANASITELSLSFDNGVFRNGVKLDVLAAACYGVGPNPLGQEKIGCSGANRPWRYDPMSPSSTFGTDDNNAHTQPDGAYHYHGDPRSMYDPSGNEASGVIGFAADGFPIYGPFIDDEGAIRRVASGYTLKSGARVSQNGEGAFPGGNYDGQFIDDYEFSDAGDLDECNGMTRDGSYGYYVTDAYPWVIKCFKGSPDSSFNKRP